VLAVQKRVLGEEHPDTLATAINLSYSLCDQGRHEEAEAMDRKLLAVDKRVLGEEHPDTLMTARNVAESIHVQGRHAVAEAMDRELIAVEKRCRERRIRDSTQCL
jgi:hypothetical protein